MSTHADDQHPPGAPSLVPGDDDETVTGAADFEEEAGGHDDDHHVDDASDADTRGGDALFNADTDDEDLKYAARQGGVQGLIEYVSQWPAYRADGTDFAITLNLYPDIENSPVITSFLSRPQFAQEESREAMLAVTITDKGRTSDGGQRSGYRLDDDPANMKMYRTICYEVEAALHAGQPPQRFPIFDGANQLHEIEVQRAGQPVMVPVLSRIPAYIQSDTIYQLLDSSFKLIDSTGNIVDVAGGTRYFALADEREWIVLQDIGRLRKKDGTTTPPRHRILHFFSEPDGEMLKLFKSSGFAMEQVVKQNKQRQENRSVNLGTMIKLYGRAALRVVGMVVGTGRGDEVRPLEVQRAEDRRYVFGTWQKNAMMPVFNNLTGVAGK